MDKFEVIRDRERVAAAKVALGVRDLPDATLTEYCKQAARITQSKMAVVTFVLADSHYTVAECGLPEDTQRVFHHEETTEVFANTLCAHVVGAGVLLSFSDTKEHPILAECLMLDMVRSYTGAPLYFRGQVIGALGVGDPQPRVVTKRQMRKLVRLAAKVSRELEAE